MLEPRIQQQFYDTADLLVQLAEPLARPLAAAAEAAVATLTAGGKLLMAGTGSAQVDALHAAALLVGRSERERPALSALALGADSGTLMGLLPAGGDVAAALARQIQALGLPGDALVLFEGHSATGRAEDSKTLLPLIEAAHARDMSVILWHGCAREAAPSPELLALLSETDVLLTVQADRLSARSLLYRLGWHAVVEAIDMQLLGETE